eukprot:248522_1
MSDVLDKGDVVLVKPSQDNECIGLVKYIGPLIDHDMMSQYIGMELLQPIPNGHNGTIDNITYFSATKGHGYHTKITNVIKKLSLKDIFHKMKNLNTLLQKQLKHISKLELLIKCREFSNNVNARKIDVHLPKLSPSTNSMDSNYSYQSVLSLATPMTNYSINTNQNAYNFGNSTKQLALKPYESSFDNNVQNIPKKLALKPSVSSFDFQKNTSKKNTELNEIKMIERRSSLESESYSSNSVSLVMPEPIYIEIKSQPTKIRNRNKNKHHKKKSNKTKCKPQKKKPNKMGRSKSHQINDKSCNKPKIKHRKKSDLIRTNTRQRSQTAEQNKMKHILDKRNHIGHVQTRTHGSIYMDNNMYTQRNNISYFPQTSPQMSTSKSTPTHITISQPAQIGGQKRFASIAEMDSNQFYLQQSNTQMIDDFDQNEITYNMYNNNNMHTPSSGQITPNMLMVNTAYSPYINHYTDHTSSNTTPNSTASLSPYQTNNEYYVRGNNMKHNISYSTNINRNQMYYTQSNGHEVYQHK